MSEPESSTGKPKPGSVSPAQGRPRREGNVSLWKRARQTLGTNSLTFLQPQSRPSHETRTDDGTGSGGGPTAPSKRREQVRHAQRTHRQRTQNYIKTLESEVVRLRGSEVSLMTERDKLQGQVNILRTTLLLSNVPLPAGVEGSPTPANQTLGSTDLPTAPDMPATVSYRTDDLSHNRLHVNWPVSQRQDHGFDPAHQQAFRELSPGKPLPNPPSNLPDDLSLQTLNFSSAPLDFNPDPINVQHQRHGLLKSLDTAEIAIDFILALEHPCMPHLAHPSQTSRSDPSGHVLMASTPLISYASAPPNPNDTWPWTANGSVIKELLHLSASINLEGEITPVEAWHRLRGHPEFGRLDRWGIDKFKGDLSRLVNCQGFGAVLDEDVYEQLLYNLLGPRQ